MDTSIGDLVTRLQKITNSLDLESLKQKRGELETRSMEPEFWNNQDAAQNIMREISDLENTISTVESLLSSAQTLLEYEHLAKEENDETALKDLYTDITALSEKLDQFELDEFLSGPYDKKDAILSIHAGQGGTEANDWAEMLMRMYSRYAEEKGWSVEILHMIKGDEAGISTGTLQISGPRAFGYLKYEKGTHRLVRLSPYNAQSLRQTSFAGVEVFPVLDTTDESDIEISPEDLEFKAVRASGPGGQHVNKTSTAVTLTHKPTGISVHSSSQRSQHQNRESAMKLLRAKLWEREMEKQQQEKAKIKGEHKAAAWGNQIRNYVLHPYKLVKDLRTKVESSDPEGVLDGDLDMFVNAEIRQLTTK